MASTDNGRPIRGVAHRVYFRIRNWTTGHNINAPTITSRLLSKDGGSYSSITDTVHNIGSEGENYIDLSASEMEAGHVSCRFVASDANSEEVTVEFYTEQGLHAGTAQGAGSGSNTIKLVATASAANDFYNDCTIEIVKGTGLGQCRTITDYVGSNQQATLDRNWKTAPAADSGYVIYPRRDGTFGSGDGVQDVNVGQVNKSTTAAENMALIYPGLLSGTVNDPGGTTATTTSFIAATGLSTTDDFYKNAAVGFTSGTLTGLWFRCTGYDGATLTFSFDEAMPVKPSHDDTFVITGHIQ